MARLARPLKQGRNPLRGQFLRYVCPSCGGTGQVMNYSLDWHSGYPYPEMCCECEGRGYVEGAGVDL